MTPLQVELARAGALRVAGRFAEAAGAYEAVLRRAPNLPDAWFNLGWVLRRLDRFDAALAAYAKAIEKGASGAEEIHVNRAVILTDDLARHDDAERELRAALKIAPSYPPALFNLANLAEDRGRRDEARVLYERLLAADPAHSEALARYAGLFSPRDLNDPIIARLQGALATPGLEPADRASLGFALGRLLDGAGAYDAAFDAYDAANTASRESAPPGKYDRAKQEALIDAMIAAFPNAPPPRPDAPRCPSLFICGMFRSGSTLAEQVLAGHPRIASGGELPFIPALAARAPSPLDADGAKRLADDYVASVRGVFPDPRVIVTDKRPDNFLFIGFIKTLFPDAKIVHTVRDPLDTCLSVYFLHLDHALRYALDLGDIAHYYTQYRRLMAHWRAIFGPDLFDFDYDAFVADPAPNLSRLLAFAGLDFHDDCLAVEKRAGAVKTASVWQVREPLYRRSSGRWRNYADRLGALRAALGV